MLILMQKNATPEQIAAVCRRIEELGYEPNEIPGSTRVAIGVTGNGGAVSAERFMHLPGVEECVPVSNAYKLVSRDSHPETTVVHVGGIPIGDGSLQIIAGPCSIESRDQIFRTAEAVAKSGVRLLRGGAFKPRTSPYSFQGLKHEGLRLLEKVREAFDLRIVTEVKDGETLDEVAAVADMLQIGARNMQNFSLLEACGRLRKPVLLKRGIGATLKELFMAAEYLLSLGNHEVVLCERGIRTYETMTRNTFDISAVPVIKRFTHLPVVADPSHGVGLSWAVPAMSNAAVVAGADAVMIEVHPQPEQALSDGQQSLTIPAYEKLVVQMRELATWRARQ